MRLRTRSTSKSGEHLPPLRRNDWRQLGVDVVLMSHAVCGNEYRNDAKVYIADFVILCLGRFKDVPNIPKSPAGKGPENFGGKAIHSMEYAAMDHEKAAAFVKGKKVAVVGFGKTGLDIAMECTSINGPEHPCTIVYRRDHRKLPDWAPWGIPLTYLYFNRFSELLVHKPGEGFVLNLLATLLSPLFRKQSNGSRTIR